MSYLVFRIEVLNILSCNNYHYPSKHVFVIKTHQINFSP